MLGFLLAILWWAVKRFGDSVREWCRLRLPVAIFATLHIFIFGPVSWLRDVHPSLVILGVTYWAPSNLTYMLNGLYFSFAFMYYLRRYKIAWWEKYNYVLAGALDGGVAFAAIIIFFSVQYHPKYVSWVSYLTSSVYYKSFLITF